MRLFPFVLAAVWVGLDQWLKAYTVANVPPYPDSVEVVPGFLALAYTANKGAAWSLFSGGTLVLTLLRAAVGVAILVYLWRQPRLPAVQRLAYGLVVGGAFGNAIDGFLRGEVVDMLLSHTLTAVYRPLFGSVYPIFNLADVGVVSGVILLLLSSLVAPKRSGQIRV